MAPKPIPNGTAEAPIEVVSSFAPVVGVNFGNSFASIAVLTKVCSPFCAVSGSTALTRELQEGVAECIANEDGERQIACAVAFQGEEMVSRSLCCREGTDEGAVHWQSS
jgi:heat shock 70kDa protein 1/2/6/8